MARKRERIFALTMAVLFFVTAFGFSFIVIWQMHDNSSASSNQTTTNPSSSSSNSKKLQGTKLSNFTPVASVSQLKVTDLTPGKGQAITSDKQTVNVIYTGAVASSGIIFQSSQDSGQTFSSALNQVIKGWQIGLIGMKVGGTRRLLIPAGEAYGANPPSGSGIPANAALVFDITLVSIGSK